MEQISLIPERLKNKNKKGNVQYNIPVQTYPKFGRDSNAINDSQNEFLHSVFFRRHDHADHNSFYDLPAG